MVESCWLVSVNGQLQSENIEYNRKKLIIEKLYSFSGISKCQSDLCDGMTPENGYYHIWD